MPLFLLSLIGLSIAADAGRDLALMQAQAQMRQQRWRMAAQSYQEILKENPDSGRAKLGLGVAYAGQNRCREALPVLAEVRGKRSWAGAAALAEGICHLQVGDPSAAFAAYDEAYWLDPDAFTLVHVALGRLDLSDDAGLEEALETLWTMEGGPQFVALIEATRALRSGVDFDLQLQALYDAESPYRSPSAALLDGRRWLDLDDPVAASEVLLRSLRRNMGHAQTVLWRAEAVRRTGQALDARSALSRPMIRHVGETPLGMCVRARIHVDLGELDEGAVLLDTHPDPLDVDVLATRWYLALARGDATEAARWAVRWRADPPSVDARLEHLIPIPLRRDPK